LIPHTREGYITWERFQQIQRTLAVNAPSAGEPGAAKQGAALLAGLLQCHRCGRKLTVRYTGRHRNMLRYCYDRGRLDQGAPKCIAFGGVSVDDEICRQLLRVVRPAAMEAAVLAHQDGRHQRDEVRSALERDLEAARYAAQRAGKQFDAADPENRLVSDELEHRWDVALARVLDLERRLATEEDNPDASANPMPDGFADMARELEEVWRSPESDARLKKRIVRTLIEEVIADVDSGAGEIIIRSIEKEMCT